MFKLAGIIHIQFSSYTLRALILGQDTESATPQRTALPCLFVSNHQPVTSMGKLDTSSLMGTMVELV